MKRRANQVDLVKMLIYILKRFWVVVLCAELGFAALYMYTKQHAADTFTASGTMYVNNGNPNLGEYQYTSAGDLNSAVQLIKTYLVVVKSEKVMNAVVERLSDDYPNITVAQVSPTLNMASVSETGVVSVISKTNSAQLSADIVNAVMEYAPEEIIRVVGAGSIEIIDYAKVPSLPDQRDTVRPGINGAMCGAVIAACILALLYLLNRRISDVSDLTNNYTPPVLASLRRISVGKTSPDVFILTNQSPMEIIESYAKLRMNLLYTLVGKESHTVVITSSTSGEGKTTIAANLAISCAMGGKKVLLVDGDLRRACQRDVFRIDKHARGLSDILVGNCTWKEAIIPEIKETLDLLPAGHFPPNPAELLESNEMVKLLKELEQVYELVLMDMPPINIVADPLVPSNYVAGCLFVTRQNFTDHRDIRKALISAEMTGMNVLGFIFYGEKISEGSYYSRRYYRKYYNKYDYRHRPAEAAALQAAEMKQVLNSEATVVADDVPVKSFKENRIVNINSAEESAAKKTNAASWQRLRKSDTLNNSIEQENVGIAIKNTKKTIAPAIQDRSDLAAEPTIVSNTNLNSLTADTSITANNHPVQEPVIGTVNPGMTKATTVQQKMKKSIGAVSSIVENLRHKK